MINTINEIIVRVLSGDASSEEMQQLLHWYEESEGNPKEFANYEMLWNAIEIIGRSKEFDSIKAYHKFAEHIKGTHNYVKPASALVKILRIAAMVVFASGVAFLAGYYLNPKLQQSNVQCQIVTPKGSKVYVELADGTKVWLNAESKLRYPEKFGDNNRNVFLEGEGYFQVAKDKQRPFIVHTSKIDIRAVGTAFNVKSYPSEEIIQTTLVEGAVIIEKKSTSDFASSGSGDNKKSLTYLNPNQQATFYKSTSKIDITSKTAVLKATGQLVAKASDRVVKKDSLLLNKRVDTGLFTAWKEDKLLFDNEPFESLSVKLERRFNMKFNFMDNEIKSFRFTGHFDEISMEQFLEALTYASPFHYVINKNNIYLSLKPIQIKGN